MWRGRGVRGSAAAVLLLLVIVLSEPTCLEADEAAAAPLWRAEEFAPCPSACGQPATTQERVVRCAGQDDTQQLEQMCGLETKPETRRVCPATEACRVYVWKAQPFSDCPVRCGHEPVLQHRVVSCVYFDQQGLEVLANDEHPLCELAAQPPSTRACQATAACTSYGWQTQPFEPCSEQCGHAAVLQTRVVQCQTSDGTAVDDELCEHVPRPPDSVQCPATAACAAHEWRAATFVPCTTECGRSSYTRTRQVHCVELEPGDALADARVVADLNCAGASRPSETRECPATDACLSYIWQAESFPDCPATCGTAALVQVREVTCTTEGRAVDATHCESSLGSDSPPESARTCPASAPCIDYSWQAPEDFAACPEDCGRDVIILSREVRCVAMAGTAESEAVESARCNAAEKPESERTCEPTPDCVVWTWTALEWSLCPTECGQEPTLQQRTVTCEGSDGTVFAAGTAEAETHCSAADPPAARRACPGTSSCVSYDWVVENPGTPFPPLCPTHCGLNGSMAVREVYCGGSDGSAVDDGNCIHETKPLSRHACPATDACVTFSWQVEPSTFPACKTACGQAEVVSTRLVSCAGSDGSVGPASKCDGDPPESRQVCRRTPDCVDFAWNALPVDFPPCPTACGNNASVQHRNVSCRGSDGSLLSGTAATDRCDAEKPASRRDCPATPPCVTYSWRVQSFPPCSTECGQEATLQSRAVLCVGTDGSETVGAAAAARCLSAGPPPPARHACTPTVACVHWRWHAEPSVFPLCPTACGQNTSVQTRRVVCEGTDGTVLDAEDPAQREVAQASARCGDAVPLTSNVCPGTQACMSFHWAAAPFPEPCPDPALCGQRERVTTRTIECRGDDGNTYDEARCLGTGVSAPPMQQVCPESAPCVLYRWVSTPAEFPACPTVCGMDESTQVRSIECHGSDGRVLTGRAAGLSCTSQPPALQRHCEATANCADQDVENELTYTWQAAEFPECGTACGLPAVVQRRQVLCIAGAERREEDGRIEEVDAERCAEAGTQPSAMRACAATEPCQDTLFVSPSLSPSSSSGSQSRLPSPPPPRLTTYQHNPAPAPPSIPKDRDTVEGERGAPGSLWLVTAVLCLVCVIIMCAACAVKDDEAGDGSVLPFARFRSSTSKGQLAGLSPTRRRTTWSDLPRDSFGAQSPSQRHTSPILSAAPSDVAEPCICMVGRESVEVAARLSTTALDSTISVSPVPVVSRWTTSASSAVRRSLSPPRQGETRQRKFLVRTPWLDNTRVSPRSPPRPARRLAEVEHISETSDSELETEDEFQRRRTGGTAGGRWDRSSGQSALAKVVEQNQPAYLYSL